jgi:hypothetical protein
MQCTYAGLRHGGAALPIRRLSRTCSPAGTPVDDGDGAGQSQATRSVKRHQWQRCPVPGWLNSWWRPPLHRHRVPVRKHGRLGRDWTR